MSTIRISRYNNYFNRRVLRGTPTTIAQFENIQFNPNDGVDTSLILNTSTMLGCDYLTEGSNSHWFIMDATRIREGQWRVTLHRDVLRDYYDSYKDSTIFIDKAVPTSANDVTIFNRENNSYNQIKKSQTLLSNDSIPWIVGYMTSKADSYTIDLTDSYPEIESIEKYKYSQYFNKNVYRPVTNNMEVYINVTGTQGSSYAIWNQRLIRSTSGWSASTNTSPSTAVTDIISSNHRGSNNVSFSSDDISTIRSQLANLFNNYDTAIKQGINETIGAPSDYSRIAAENNKIYRSQENGKLYKITATTINDTISKLGVKVNNYLYMKLDSINDQVNSWTFTAHDTSGIIPIAGDLMTYPSKNYEISGAFNGLILQYEEYTPTSRIEIPANRTHCNDSQYDIFMIPFGNQGTTTKADNIKLAYTLISSLSGSGALYDLQILPFKPEYNASTVVSATGLNAQMRFIDKASDNFTINHTLTCATTVKGRKKQSECQFYRLSSPNWAGSYEFNVAKNMADITQFKVSYTLKPYTPYVRICPVFNQNGLYAGHNSDAMGLILSGDFSLAMINDAWATYQLNNKNYEKMFDRDIQSLDLQQRIQKSELGWSIAANTVGASANAFTGATLASGNPILGGVAAGIGAGISVGAGIADYNNQMKLMEDTRSASIDKFNWQLGNIKATPNTLTKVGSYNIDNKYSFVLEEYDATDAEKDILENLLEYEGYTINKIATIDDYSTSNLNYLKGRFIRLDIEDDSHVAYIINYEIAKGVFI